MLQFDKQICRNKNGKHFNLLQKKKNSIVKKIGSHKSYDFLKTNEFRLKIPFAFCYLDI